MAEAGRFLLPPSRRRPGIALARILDELVQPLAARGLRLRRSLGLAPGEAHEAGLSAPVHSSTPGPVSPASARDVPSGRRIGPLASGRFQPISGGDGSRSPAAAGSTRRRRWAATGSLTGGTDPVPSDGNQPGSYGSQRRSPRGTQIGGLAGGSRSAGADLEMPLDESTGLEAPAGEDGAAVSHDALPHDALPHDAVSHDALPHDALPHDALPHDAPAGRAGGLLAAIGRSLDRQRRRSIRVRLAAGAADSPPRYDVPAPGRSRASAGAGASRSANPGASTRPVPIRSLPPRVPAATAPGGGGKPPAGDKWGRHSPGNSRHEVAESFLVDPGVGPGIGEPSMAFAVGHGPGAESVPAGGRSVTAEPADTSDSLATEARLRRLLSRILVRDASAHGIDLRER